MGVVRLWVTLAVLAQLGGRDPAARALEEGGEPVLHSCLVKVQDDVRIPAQEAGVLIQFPVKEGTRVAKGDLLAVIDARQAEAALRVAKIALEAAEKRAENVIEEKYAKKAAEVAYFDWQQDLKANLDHAGAIPDIEVRQKKLVFERSKLQIEKAKKDREMASLDAKTKEAERDAAQMAIDRRTILAPFDGEVVTTYLHESEWVSPGDPILRLVRLDTLYVEDFLDASLYNPSDVQGKPVTVSVALARGREVSAPGTIVYVNQLVQSDGSYLVRAEVQNQRENDHWLIRPGLPTKMTIHWKK